MSRTFKLCSFVRELFVSHFVGKVGLERACDAQTSHAVGAYGPFQLTSMSAVTILKRPRDESVQTQRKYFRKTAKGKVVKGKFLSSIHLNFLQSPWAHASSSVLRERYLRDDIACGIIGLCDSTNPTLPARGDLTHTTYPNGHYILPDTNVFLHQVRIYLKLPDSITHNSLPRWISWSLNYWSRPS